MTTSEKLIVCKYFLSSEYFFSLAFIQNKCQSKWVHFFSAYLAEDGEGTFINISYFNFGQHLILLLLLLVTASTSTAATTTINCTHFVWPFLTYLVWTFNMCNNSWKLLWLLQSILKNQSWKADKSKSLRHTDQFTSV